MNLFSHNKIQFKNHDPLDDGLAEEIAAEQNEAEAFGTLDDIDADTLIEHWATIAADVEQNPTSFAVDEE